MQATFIERVEIKSKQLLAAFLLAVGLCFVVVFGIWEVSGVDIKLGRIVV